MPGDKLPRFADLNKHCLKPALEELNQITDYVVTIGAIKKGRSIDQLLLTWMRKSPEAAHAAAVEREASRVGRAARRTRCVEVILDRE